MPTQVLAEFALLSLLLELTPGPNMAWLALVAATEGRGRGYAAVAGVALGLALMGLAAMLGLAALIAASPALFAAMKWAGVGYLLWMAWDAWAEAGEVAGPEAGTPALTYFRRGLVTNLLNPKAALFYVTMLPGFVDPSGEMLPQTLWLIATYVGIATLIHAGIVTGAGSVQGLVARSGRVQAVRRGMALGLVAVAVWTGVK